MSHVNNKKEQFRFKNYTITFQDTSLTFHTYTDFTVYLKPYFYHIDSNFAIYVQEKCTKSIYMFDHPFNDKTFVCNTHHNFLGVINTFFVCFDQENLYFTDRMDVYNTEKYNIGKYENLILHSGVCFVVTSTSIYAIYVDKNKKIQKADFVKNLYNNIKNRQKGMQCVKAPENEKCYFNICTDNNNEIEFYMDLLVINGMVFFGQICVSEQFTRLNLMPFYTILINLMTDDEKIYTYRKLFKKADFTNTIINNRNCTATYSRWANAFDFEMLKPYDVLLNNDYKVFFQNFLQSELLPLELKKFSCIFSNLYFKHSVTFAYSKSILKALLNDPRYEEGWHNKATDKYGSIMLNTYLNENVDRLDNPTFCKTMSLLTLHERLFSLDIFIPYKIILMNEINKERSITVYNIVDNSDAKQLDLYLKEAVDLLDDMEVGCFEFDENDLLKKRNKAFITRQSANLGKCYLFYDIGNKNVPLDAKGLNLRVKVDTVEKIETPEYIKKWGDFIFACNYALLALGTDHIYEESIFNHHECNKITALPFSEREQSPALAGAIFALALNKRVTEGLFCKYISSKNDEVVFSSIIGYSLSHRTNYNVEIKNMIIGNIKKPANFAVKLSSILGTALIYKGTNNGDIINTIVKEHSLVGLFDCNNTKGNKIWYNEPYRIFTTFAISLVCNQRTKFIKLENSFCEILLNGIIFSMSGNTKILPMLERADNCKPEELFYSELFKNLITFERTSQEIIKSLQVSTILDINTAYKAAGNIFYIAFKELDNQTNCLSTDDSVYDYLYKLCLESEEDMIECKFKKIIFDYTLISLCLIRNGTCDLRILRILRRQVRKTHRSKFLENLNDYITFFETMDTQYGLSFGDMLKYKMCIGILSLGHGKSKLKFDKNAIFNIIATFFINFPVTQSDQEYLLVYRYFLYFSIEKQKDEKIKDTFESQLANLFNKAILDMACIERKITFDLLASYFEANHALMDIEYFKKAYCDYCNSK